LFGHANRFNVSVVFTSRVTFGISIKTVSQF